MLAASLPAGCVEALADKQALLLCHRLVSPLTHACSFTACRLCRGPGWQASPAAVPLAAATRNLCIEFRCLQAVWRPWLRSEPCCCAIGCCTPPSPQRYPLHAGCVEALAEERALLLCHWLVHRPPADPAALGLTLRLLHALAPFPAAAWAAAAQGGALYLLTLLLPPQELSSQEKVSVGWLSGLQGTVLRLWQEVVEPSVCGHHVLLVKTAGQACTGRPLQICSTCTALSPHSKVQGCEILCCYALWTHLNTPTSCLAGCPAGSTDGCSISAGALHGPASAWAPGGPPGTAHAAPRASGLAAGELSLTETWSLMSALLVAGIGCLQDWCLQAGELLPHGWC